MLWQPMTASASATPTALVRFMSPPGCDFTSSTDAAGAVMAPAPTRRPTPRVLVVHRSCRPHVRRLLGELHGHAARQLAVLAHGRDRPGGRVEAPDRVGALAVRRLLRGDEEDASRALVDGRQGAGAEEPLGGGLEEVAACGGVRSSDAGDRHGWLAASMALTISSSTSDGSEPGIPKSCGSDSHRSGIGLPSILMLCVS